MITGTGPDECSRQHTSRPDPWRHQVQDDEIGRTGQNPGQGTFAVADHLDDEAGPFQVPADDIAAGRVVVDDQRPRRYLSPPLPVLDANRGSRTRAAGWPVS